jgi:HK97 family phage prohead protease
MTKRIEYRIFKTQIRAKGDTPQIEGYAAVFNTETDLGWFRESIAPGAFKRALSEKQDVRCLFNHEPDHVLGRTKSGTLALNEDNTGLHFVCDLPETQMGKDVRAMILRGDVDQCSFGFIVREEDVVYGDKSKDTVRVIKDVDLFDVSPVTYPAYPTTSVEARSNAESFKKFRDPNGNDGDEMPHDDPDPPECECDCRACYSAECEECDMHMQECGDSERCMSGTRSMTPEQRSSKAKRVDGEDLTSGAFAYVGDKGDTSTWKLPIKFSTEEKTKSHIRNALARFNQTKGIPADKKPEVLAKIKAAAKEHGIHTGDESKGAELTLELAKARTRNLEISLSIPEPTAVTGYGSNDFMTK